MIKVSIGLYPNLPVRPRVPATRSSNFRGLWGAGTQETLLGRDAKIRTGVSEITRDTQTGMTISSPSVGNTRTMDVTQPYGGGKFARAPSAVPDRWSNLLLDDRRTIRKEASHGAPQRAPGCRQTPRNNSRALHRKSMIPTPSGWFSQPATTSKTSGTQTINGLYAEGYRGDYAAS